MGASRQIRHRAGPRCARRIVPAATANAASGFTLVELMITIAVVSVLMVLAAPSLRDFIAKNRIAGVSNEFTAAILTARSEAIRRNTCVSMCVSTTARDALPACSPDEDDWQKGWLVFVNKTCEADDATPETLADILQARAPEASRYTMVANRNLINFTSQGLTQAGTTTFELRMAGEANYAYNRNILLAKQGRTRIVAATATSTDDDQ